MAPMFELYRVADHVSVIGRDALVHWIKVHFDKSAFSMVHLQGKPVILEQIIPCMLCMELKLYVVM